VIAMGLEGYALRTAAQVANRTRGADSWWNFIRHAKAPEVPTILLEDAGAVLGLNVALLGVGLTVLTGNALFDTLATVVIGILLVTIAAILAVETKSLLVGESASTADIEKIERALRMVPQFNRIVDVRTMHLGPDEILVTANVAVSPDDDGAMISKAIDSAEAHIRHAVSKARYIVIEPDVEQAVPASRTAT
jgi:divalent metal cation (Fe/Co/Zn/Cd) transporter